MPKIFKEPNVMLRTFKSQMSAAVKDPDFDSGMPDPILGIRISEEVQPDKDAQTSIIFAIKDSRSIKVYALASNELFGQFPHLQNLVLREPKLKAFRLNTAIRGLRKILLENADESVLMLRREGAHEVIRDSKTVAVIMVTKGHAMLMHGSWSTTVHIDSPEESIDVATPEEWNEEIGKHLNGNRRMLLGVLVALAPPLITLLGRKPPAVVLVGPSSIGKSTILRVAQSVYSPNTTIPMMTGTSLGLREAVAKNYGKANIFDEISSADNASVLIDMLFDSEGQAVRHRSAAASSAPSPSYSSDVSILFANEFGVAESLKQHRRSGTQGTWARVLEVHPSPSRGMFNTVPEDLQTYEFAEALKNSAARCGGALWHPWLAFIGANSLAARNKWAKRLDRIVKEMRNELTSKESIQQRLIQSAAIWILAGELAVDAGLLTIDRQTPFKAVKHLLRLHFKRISTGAESISLTTGVVKAVAKLRNQIKDWPVLGSNPMPHHTRKKVGGCMCLLILPIALDDVLGRGEKRTNTLQALKTAGLLKCPQKGWSSQFNWPGNKASKPRFYVFDEKILSYE